MSTSMYPLAEYGPGALEKNARQRALAAAENARRAATLLENAFELMAEDDRIQPAIKHVYAALCEAETRAAVIEDWYERTYLKDILADKPCQPAS